MPNFDQPQDDFEHRFVKYNPKMLQNIFGSQDVEPFWVADMGFEVAEPITTELQRLIQRGVYSYEFDSASLYQAITDWNAHRHQLALDPGYFAQVPTVLTAIALLLSELTEPGDGVLIQTPVFHQFRKVISSAKREVVKNPLKIVDNHYEIDFEDLELKLQQENVRVLLLCNPHNPIARVWTHQELEQMAALAEAADVTIISDEIHADIVFAPNRFNSIAGLGSDKHIALLGSPSKTFGMQSISNGFMYLPSQETRERVKATIDAMYLGHGNALSTFATIAALRHGEPWLDALLEYLGDTLVWIEHFLDSELTGVKSYPVEGTYQIWLNFDDLNYSQDELQQRVFEEAKMGLTPGSWFGAKDGQFMRMNLAYPRANIKEAFHRLRDAV